MSSTSNTRRRKPRVVYSKDEVRYLKDYFLLCPNPDSKQQVAIATYLKKSKSEISTWFKNRRTYVKIKESREKPTTPDQIPPEIEVFNQENFLFQVNQPSNSINCYQQVLPTLNQVKTDFVVEKRARKARFTFTQQLKKALEEEYAKCSYPEHSKKKEIAERLQIDPEVVSYWYKNRRTKARKESGKENAAPSPPSWPTPPQTPPQPNTILEPHIYYEYQLYDQPSMSLEAPMEIQLQNPVSSFPPDSSSSNFSNVLNEIYQSMYQLFISFI